MEVTVTFDTDFSTARELLALCSDPLQLRLRLPSLVPVGVNCGSIGSTAIPKNELIQLEPPIRCPRCNALARKSRDMATKTPVVYCTVCEWTNNS